MNCGTAESDPSSNHWTLCDQFVVLATPMTGEVHLVGVCECARRPSSFAGRLLTMNAGSLITEPWISGVTLLTRMGGLTFLTSTVLNLLAIAHVDILLI
jgi:hypothetical protein